MKESIRAAREELAHNEIVAGLKELLGDDHPKVRKLEGLREHRMPSAVRATLENEVVAKAIKELGSQGASLEEHVEAIRKAPDEDLLALEGIGKASLKKLREAL